MLELETVISVSISIGEAGEVFLPLQLLREKGKEGKDLERAERGFINRQGEMDERRRKVGFIPIPIPIPTYTNTMHPTFNSVISKEI
jgi:hypothetical protein